jgi:hypothetical protein
VIESGLSNFALTNAAITALLGQSAVEREATPPAYSSFYFSFLPKNGTLPAIILDRLKSEDADDTLDARTPAPGVMIEARFQLGCVAQDQEGTLNQNPASPSGYLSACLLSQALRRQLMGLATGNAILPDGTLIKDLWILDEYDAHYEIGGAGYLYRRVLQIGMLFQETK